jgi:hypothetical protein
MTERPFPILMTLHFSWQTCRTSTSASRSSSSMASGGSSSSSLWALILLRTLMAFLVFLDGGVHVTPLSLASLMSLILLYLNGCSDAGILLSRKSGTSFLCNFPTSSGVVHVGGTKGGGVDAGSEEIRGLSEMFSLRMKWTYFWKPWKQHSYCGCWSSVDRFQYLLSYGFHSH